MRRFLAFITLIICLAATIMLQPDTGVKAGNHRVKKYSGNYTAILTDTTRGTGNFTRIQTPILLSPWVSPDVMLSGCIIGDAAVQYGDGTGVDTAMNNTDSAWVVWHAVEGANDIVIARDSCLPPCTTSMIYGTDPDSGLWGLTFDQIYIEWTFADSARVGNTIDTTFTVDFQYYLKLFTDD